MEIEEETVLKNPSWWRRRTALELILMLSSIFGIIGIIVLSITLTAREDTTSNGVANNICLTPGCIHAATHILDAIDTTVEPCDDFYNFACGGFIKNTLIPDEQLSVDTFTIVRGRLKEQLRTLISESPKPEESKPFTLAKDLFKACMSTATIEERGIEPLKVILDSMGGWPVVKGDSWDERSSWTWIQSVKDFRKAGFNTAYIFGYTIEIDLKNSLSRTIYIGQASTIVKIKTLTKGIEDKIGIESKSLKAYYEYMVDIAVTFGANRTRAERELKDSLNFEVALATISLPKEKLRNVTALYNPMTLKETQVKYPYVPWVEYFNALLPTGLKVDENETIINIEPTYFELLDFVLKITPNRTIANYLMWRMTLDSSPYLTESLRNRKLIYDTALNGKQEQEPRWKECITITSDRLPISVGAMYVRHYFKQGSKKAAVELVNRIRAQFEIILAENHWMDANTKAAALNKLEAIYTHIGYPDELMDNRKLEQLYSGWEIDPDKYFESMLRMNVFVTDYSLNKLRKPVNKTDWVTRISSATVNAGYSSMENSIQIPAGILQGQFFSAERPRYMNYGAIGAIIGHEITHGFDDQGSQLDFNGNLVDWWKPETKARYLEKTTCIIQQYGNYTEPTTKVQLKGINTQGENIADNGGFKVSYLAYLKWVKDNAPESKLPGLNYTPQQLFWVSAAQTWCSVYREESMKMNIELDGHSPAKFRVIGSFSNMKDFSTDFNCPVGSPMNPTHKCEVW